MTLFTLIKNIHTEKNSNGINRERIPGTYIENVSELSAQIVSYMRLDCLEESASM